MAITKSAKKANRQSKRRKAINDLRRKGLKLALKQVRDAQKDDVKALAAAYKAIDKALKGGIMKKNTAARRKARVARILKA
jgi:small subunit ribosomal protein S20